MKRPTTSGKKDESKKEDKTKSVDKSSSGAAKSSDQPKQKPPKIGFRDAIKTLKERDEESGMLKIQFVVLIIAFVTFLLYHYRRRLFS